MMSRLSFSATLHRVQACTRSMQSNISVRFETPVGTKQVDSDFLVRLLALFSIIRTESQDDELLTCDSETWAEFVASMAADLHRRAILRGICREYM